jgi:hypothetical protein
MNKKIILMSALLFSFNGWAMQHRDNPDSMIYGTLECKVIDQVILGINNGKTQRYDGAERLYLLNIGDTARFEYELFQNDDLFEPNNIQIEFWDRYTGLISYQIYKGVSTKKQYWPLLNNVHERYKIENTNKSGSELTIYKDYLFFDNGTKRIYFKRYYKDNWEAILTIHNDSDGSVLALDCRTGIDQYDKLLQALDEYAEENE